MQPPRAASDEEHACQIVKLRAQKRQLTLRLDRVNKLLDAELIAARQDKTLYSVIGAAVQVAEGRAPTADDLAKVERELRKLTHHAKRRRDPTGNQARVAAGRVQRETARMPTPYRRRVIDEWYDSDDTASPPPELGNAAPPKPDPASPPPPRTVGDSERPDDDEDDEDDDYDEDDEDE